MNNLYILEPNWSYCGGGMVVVAKDINSISEQILQLEKDKYLPNIKYFEEQCEKFKHLKDCGGYLKAIEKEKLNAEKTEKIKVFSSIKDSKEDENDWIITHTIPINKPEQVLLYNYNYA